MMDKDVFIKQCIKKMHEMLSTEFQESLSPHVGTSDFPTIWEYDEMLWLVDTIWNPIISDFEIGVLTPSFNKFAPPYPVFTLYGCNSGRKYIEIYYECEEIHFAYHDEDNTITLNPSSSVELWDEIQKHIRG